MSTFDHSVYSRNMNYSSQADRCRSVNPVVYRSQKLGVFTWKRMLKFLIPLVLVISIFAVLLSGTSQTQANEYEHASKQFKSIVIHPGDSLWSIASEYSDGHYSSIQEYIDELMFINCLDSDVILAGEYLLIPYYVG